MIFYTRGTFLPRRDNIKPAGVFRSLHRRDAYKSPPRLITAHLHLLLRDGRWRDSTAGGKKAAAGNRPPTKGASNREINFARPTR